jgi:hypothetical protein
MFRYIEKTIYLEKSKKSIIWNGGMDIAEQTTISKELYGYKRSTANGGGNKGER